MKKTTKKTTGWASAVLTSAGMLFAGMTVLPAGAASPAKGVDTSHHSHSEGRAIDWSSARSSGHSWPLLKTGHRGTNVRTIHHLLAPAGYRLEVDGAFGSNTASATEAFQKRHGLQADGIVGPNTWNALVTTVRSGSSGHAVVGRAVLDNLLPEHPRWRVKARFRKSASKYGFKRGDHPRTVQAYTLDTQVIKNGYLDDGANR